MLGTEPEEREPEEQRGQLLIYGRGRAGAVCRNMSPLTL